MPANQYPEGLKPGDFIQTTNHFGDIFFEVVRCTPPSANSSYWSISFVTYEKYGATPRPAWVNSASSIRHIIPAEMAVPVMTQRRLRFKAAFGQYDPIYGFAPAGTPLRQKAA